MIEDLDTLDVAVVLQQLDCIFGGYFKYTTALFDVWLLPQRIDCLYHSASFINTSKDLSLK
jgi:hypothetical protein